METNINVTYKEGLQLINRLASLEYNANNDCPDFDLREYGETFSCACDFVVWCKENDKAADLRYYFSSKCSKGCPGNEWESLRATFKMRGLEI